MALKRGLSGVNRIRGSGGGSGGGSRSVLVSFIFLCVFAPLVFFVGRGVYIDSSIDYSNASVKQNLDWRERLAMQSVRSLFSKEILDVIATSTSDLGPLSLDSFKKNSLPASWRGVGVENQTTPDVKSNIVNEKRNGTLKDGSHQKVETPAKIQRRQLREKRREMRANELVQHNDDTILKLENAAIERSKSVDSAVLGKYSIWRRENENENSDSNIRLMRDQVIMARVYVGIAKLKNKTDLLQELQSRLKDSQRVLGEATSDADLPRSAHEKLRAMGQVLAKAKMQLYDCNLVTGKLRAMLQTADEQVRSLKKQSTFLAQLAAK